MEANILEPMPLDNPFDLTGRVALITGASSHGIGSNSAMMLAKYGAKVFLTGIIEENLQQIKAEVEEIGGTAEYCLCDVTSEEQCEASVKACIETFGKLDIMILAAGISGNSPSGGPDAWFDTPNWEKVTGIDLDGVWFMVKHGWQECAKGGVGSIVMISSIAAWTAEGSPAYTASKGAIRSLTHSLGAFFGPYGVRINSIYPGFTVTDLTGGAVNYAPFVEMKTNKIPLRKFAHGSDIAAGALYLASDAARFVTGTHLVIDGGECC